MIDLAAVSARMIELEFSIPQADRRDDVPMWEVLAKLAEIDTATPGLPDAVMAEIHRAKILSNGAYRHIAARTTGREVGEDDPAVIGTVAFLQGVTFARAVADVKGDSLLAYLDDAITKWRGKVKQAEAELERDGSDAGENHLIARCYVDAFQSVRTSMFGELLP